MRTYGFLSIPLAVFFMRENHKEHFIPNVCVNYLMFGIILIHYDFVRGFFYVGVKWLPAIMIPRAYDTGALGVLQLLRIFKKPSSKSEDHSRIIRELNFWRFFGIFVRIWAFFGKTWWIFLVYLCFFLCKVLKYVR